MGQKPMGRRLNYVKGFTLANCRGFFEFHFKEFYHRMDADLANWRFNLYLFEKVNIQSELYVLEDCYDLEDFKKHFGNGINVIKIEFKN